MNQLPFWPLPAESDLLRLLEDDVGFGDLTTRALGIGHMPGRISFSARAPMRLCGVEEAAGMLALLGAEIGFSAASGMDAEGGELILSVTGPASVLHAGWKMAQLVMEFASGVASEAADIVAAARAVAPNIAVMVTRKSVPFARTLSLKAALAGGAEIHRLGLHDSVLIFPEHMAFFEDGLAGAVMAARRVAPERAVMVEVTDEAGALAASMAGADVIQLEKFTPEAAAALARTLPKRSDGRPFIGAAGGVTAKNAAAYAAAGVDTLVTSSPFMAKPRDIKVVLEKA
ncbi:ModD protein [Acidocella sp.]|uniref:ModD protein n=1 Tax=Acidocella sp. TaxID=50710 RepID=UPI003D008B5B